MYILMPCKKSIKEQDTTNMLFENIQVHFGIQGASSYIEISKFSMTFGIHVGRLWTPR
jgi:hypothetical protein